MVTELPSDQLSVSDAVRYARDAIRDLDPRSIRGEIVELRDRRSGATAAVVADNDAAVDILIPRAGRRRRAQQLTIGQVVTFEAKPRANRDGCEWFYVAEELAVVEAQGPIARRTTADLRELHREGVVPDTGAFQFPQPFAHQALPKSLSKILVLTSQEAAGWGDFRTRGRSLDSAAILEPRWIRFRGEGWVQELIDAIEAVTTEDADLVCIVRGGGRWADLRPFDDPGLARAINACACRVVTAIGHERDISLADRAAYVAYRTPTDAAAARERAAYLRGSLRRPALRKATRRPHAPPVSPSPATSSAALEASLRAQTADLRARLAEERDAHRLTSQELARCRADLEQERRRSTRRLDEKRRLLLDHTLARVRRRSRWAAAAWWLASVGVLVVTVQLGRVSTVLAAIAILLAAIGAYVWRGPARAVSPSRRSDRGRSPQPIEPWEGEVRRARTPRELRRLRQTWPHD